MVSRCVGAASATTQYNLNGSRIEQSGVRKSLRRCRRCEHERKQCFLRRVCRWGEYASKSSGGTTWAVFSDERLKNIKGRFKPGLSALLQLQPLRYQYKPDNALGLPGESEEVGFSAQA